MSWAVLRWAAWAVAAAHLIMAVGVWLPTLRTLGMSSLRVCPRMLRMSLRASLIREAAAVLLLPLAAALLGLWWIGRAPFAPLPLDAILCVALLYFAQLLVPPVALVLSSSTDEQLRWALGLKKFTAGRRVVSLLDTEYMVVRPAARDLLSTTLRRAGSLTDVLRVPESADWQDGVRELIDITPIVILDTRVCTEALLFEASSVLTPEYAHKAVFVSDADGACPVLERLLDEGRLPPGRALNVVTESELGPLLRRLLASREALPRPGGSISGPQTVAGTLGEQARRRGLKQTELRYAGATPNDGRAAADSLQSGREVLSTPLTLAWRLTALAGVPYLLGATAVVMLPALLGHPARAMMWVLLGLNWAAFPIYFYLTHSLRKVSISGDTLFVSNYLREIPIHISHVDRVSGPDWTGLRRITLQLRQSSAFGTKIVFAGKFFSAGKVARELRRRLHAHAEETRRAGAPVTRPAGRRFP